MTSTTQERVPALPFERYSATGGASRTFPVRNPATDETIIELADASVEDALTGVVPVDR